MRAIVLTERKGVLKITDCADELQRATCLMCPTHEAPPPPPALLPVLEHQMQHLRQSDHLKLLYFFLLMCRTCDFKDFSLLGSIFLLDTQNVSK